MWNWGSKLRGRSWVETLSGGLSQIYTKVLGTIVVSPPTPKILTLLVSQEGPIALIVSVEPTLNLFVSVESPIALKVSQ